MGHISQDTKCFFNNHKYEILKEEVIQNRYNDKLGVAIINRCTNCGKIKVINVITSNNVDTQSLK